MQEHGPVDPGSVKQARFDVVAIATSAGGLKALKAILSRLDPRFPVPVLIVQHLSRTRESIMAEILSHSTPLRVKQAEDGERIVAGCVYTGPSDHHFLVKPDGTISLTHTDLVHFVRPSADLLFESVAAGYGSRAIAVVATGSGFDGATGVQAIKNSGGKVIVQDEVSSEFFGMPGAAIDTGDADLILPLTEIGPALNRLVLVI
jgi:two-component system, chemotaxis family, protein-glutamate methylesterase/glutaminase